MIGSFRILSVHYSLILPTEDIRHVKLDGVCGPQKAERYDVGSQIFQNIEAQYCKIYSSTVKYTAVL